MLKNVREFCAHWQARLAYKFLFGRPRPYASDFSVAIPFAAPSPGGLRCAVMIHLFHSDMARAFHNLIRASGLGADLLVTTDTAKKRDQILAAFDGYTGGLVTVRIVENRGRDILPKLTAFNDEYAAYDLLLFLHSKKSNPVSGDAWREFLFDHLLGSPEIAASIVDLFRSNPKIGFVFPQHFEPLRQYADWGPWYNFPAAQPLARRLGFTLKRRAPIDFPSGSMFWCRPAALLPLLELGLTRDDFPEEAGQTDGTIAHAVERLFLYATEIAGFDWLKVAVPRHFERRETIVTLEGAAGAGAFLDRHRLVLMHGLR
jgi:lipopolysaccharide biosynthesis protein